MQMTSSRQLKYEMQTCDQMADQNGEAIRWYSNNKWINKPTTLYNNRFGVQRIRMNFLRVY
jgi:hypothetical protein